jgi:hypothetical protein
MAAIESPSLGNSTILEMLSRARPAVESTVTHVESAVELLVGLSGADTVTARVKPGGPGYLQNWASATRDPWLIDTMSTIKSFRSVKNGWDGMDAVAPKRSHLGTAEMLASFLAMVPDRLRPILSVDAQGRPTYANNTGNFYIHLTIDSDTTLTWYAEINGVEYFQDEIEFKGRAMPVELKELFDTASA